MATFGTITSQGVGSNIDIAGIVSKLMDIERIPLQRLDKKKADYDARISALGTIKSKLSTLQTSLTGLNLGTSFLASKAESSNTAIVRATGTSGAIAGNYSITNISQLAQSQKLVAGGQADTTTAIGVGTLTIDLGTISGGTFDSGTGKYSGAGFTPNSGGSHDIVIDSSNNSLAGIRDAINSANIGVRASIVNDGDAANPYRLVLSSTSSGADQSVRIAVAGDATLSNLLAHDPTGAQNLSETVSAQNAVFEVDGIAIIKSSNTITDVISGVTLELMGESSGATVTVAVSQDNAVAKTAIESFITAYNDLYAEIKKQTETGYAGGTAGALASDSVTRQIHTSIRDEINTMPTGITGAYTSLSSIGVAFQSDGTLALDETVLNTALATDNNNVAELFTSADGYATRLDALVFDMLSVSGTIESRTESYKDHVKTLDDQRLTLESRLERTEQTLRARFTALDVLISSMSVTSSYLSQQLDILNAQSSGG